MQADRRDARVAGEFLKQLRHINVGPVEAELALWGKNLTNRKDATFGLGVGYSSSLEYLPPRTFGVDLNIDF